MNVKSIYNELFKISRIIKAVEFEMPADGNTSDQQFIESFVHFLKTEGMKNSYYLPENIYPNNDHNIIILPERFPISPIFLNILLKTLKTPEINRMFFNG